MSAYEADPRVSDFTTCLTQRARACFQGQVSLGDLIRALDRGWSPAAMAKACSNDLPAGDPSAYAMVQRRIRWYAEHQPSSATPASAGTAPWCGRCDDESFRWIVDGQGKPLQPCPDCSPQRAAAGRPA